MMSTLVHINQLDRNLDNLDSKTGLRSPGGTAPNAFPSDVPVTTIPHSSLDSKKKRETEWKSPPLSSLAHHSPLPILPLPLHLSLSSGIKTGDHCSGEKLPQHEWHFPFHQESSTKKHPSLRPPEVFRGQLTQHALHPEFCTDVAGCKDPWGLLLGFSPAEQKVPFTPGWSRYRLDLAHRPESGEH